VGQQGTPGKTEEAEAATGAVDFNRPGCRSTGPPHLYLRRHYDWSIEHSFRVVKSEAGLTHYEGRQYVGLVRRLILGLVVLGFVSIHTDRLRGEKPARDDGAGVPGVECAGHGDVPPPAWDAGTAPRRRGDPRPPAAERTGHEVTQETAA
jgi:hypothetical protein